MSNFLTNVFLYSLKDRSELSTSRLLSADNWMRPDISELLIKYMMHAYCIPALSIKWSNSIRFDKSTINNEDVLDSLVIFAQIAD